MKLQKRTGTYWLQPNRRVTVDDKSSANTLAGFSSVQMAPIQEGGAASSANVAEMLPNTAGAGKTSKESASIEQGQTASSGRTRSVGNESESEANFRKRPTQRQRDIHGAHTPAAGSLVSTMCVWKGR